ncbi:16S rRNA (adenine(1518)-N(6)/adenine(1519)-N(6))-dimethyltransferase RsmA [Latilactobacillus graminis]|uniref:Ribosomal RNA small subunit methyltransferase A n=2 Tax=Latilactobacillus graminis TaxID=60519 RepID=A0AA89KYL8_9LACO|nr:16S rRNA (adenine(1518)-N(6)/adenine(1519)-N(6))-dimethyltransferase RsmA [Latilactobacillus graminis]KRM24513.1 dimethyladenosine transferase [Latilactobacillus graminis DSM 20719]QFP79033.1 16S rRNA (adenine(1518)-N(6)/adenine(1519)-N(6))-dimethyltransferase RsmA [Latilactobacillus graminis]
MEDIANPERTRKILKRYGFKFKKSLGQNFLTNITILKQIVAAGDITKDDDVIEIGPGIGSLTEQIARKAHRVLSFEIDARLMPVLKDTLNHYHNVTVLNQDILEADLKTIIAEQFDGQHNLKIVANLPYYITTPIMLHLLEAGLPINRMVLMMQKEVAERINAVPGSKAYGSLSIAVQLHSQVNLAFIVPKTAFMPQPNVDSAIVELVGRQEPLVTVTNQTLFDQLVRGAFAQRRKTLWNNLQNQFGKQEEVKAALTIALEAVEIAPSSRAEQLSIQQFAQLSDALNQQSIFIKKAQ